MLAYVRKFTYLSAAKNSNKEYLTYGKGTYNLRKSLLSEAFNASKAFYALSLDKVINACLTLYRRMRQMDKDGKKMVAHRPTQYLHF